MKRIISPENKEQVTLETAIEHIENHTDCLVVLHRLLDNSIGVLHATTYDGDCYQFLSLTNNTIGGNSWDYSSDTSLSLRLILKEALEDNAKEVLLFNDFKELCEWYAWGH
jgi:hypothetical protein